MAAMPGTEQTRVPLQCPTEVRGGGERKVMLIKIVFVFDGAFFVVVFCRLARTSTHPRWQELGLAVNVHSRAAGHHAITLLRNEGITRAVLHAFDGKTK